MSSPLSSSVVKVGTLLQYLDQWRNMTFKRFVFKGHHLKPRYHAPLFHNFKQFNIKAATANQPFIHEEVDELLAKGAIEPLTGGAGFYSNVLFLSMLVVYDPYST